MRRTSIVWSIIPCLTTVTFFWVSSFAQAHPGRTDSKGCHTDHSTGQYHCHHDNNPTPNQPVCQTVTTEITQSTLYKGNQIFKTAQVTDFVKNDSRLHSQDGILYQYKVAGFRVKQFVTNDKTASWYSLENGNWTPVKKIEQVSNTITDFYLGANSWNITQERWEKVSKTQEICN